MQPRPAIQTAMLEFGRRTVANLPIAALGLLLCLPIACGGGFKRFLYEGVDRDDWQQPRRVIADLQIEPGDRIADLGAGGGYFTRWLAAATGETGVVYAIDVDVDMVDYLSKLAEREKLPQVRAVLAEPDDPMLPEGEIDLVFLSNTYHHIENRPEYFARLRKSLAPGGRVAIVELREEGLFYALFGHATGSDEIEREMEEAGYRLERTFDYLDRQHFLVFGVAVAASAEEAKIRADEAAGLLTAELMSRLQSAVAAGGPANAVRVCSEVAQDVTDRLAGRQGLSIRRTALRVRNPENLPDPFEREWLESAAAAVRAGGQVASLYEIVQAPGGGSELRHLRPIIFPGGVCSSCHGPAEQIDPEVRAILRERYPDDQAIGFEPGDLRGAVSVRVPIAPPPAPDRPATSLDMADQRLR